MKTTHTFSFLDMLEFITGYRRAITEQQAEQLVKQQLAYYGMSVSEAENEMIKYW